MLELPNEIHTHNGSPMVLVPAGEFIRGADDLEDYEGPAHTVYLDPFYIDKYLVTNIQFKTFIRETSYVCEGIWRKHYQWGKRNHPVVAVTWNDANTYAEWASKKLPTEAQWEKAARGADGRRFPWGNTWDSSKCCCWENGDRGTAAVGTHHCDVSPYGVYDMGGNVHEWLRCWASIEDYGDSARQNPGGADSGTRRAVRGGSWFCDREIDFRCATRGGCNPAHPHDMIGFRCVKEIENSDCATSIKLA